MPWGLPLAATLAGVWAQVCSGSSSLGAQGQEGGRKWAAGQQVAMALGSQHFASQHLILTPRVLPLLRTSTTFILEPSSLPLVREENQPGAPALDLGHGPHRKETEAQGQEGRPAQVAEPELRTWAPGALPRAPSPMELPG